MRFKDWATRVLLISLMFIALSMALVAGRVAQLQNSTASTPEVANWSPYPSVQFQSEKNEVKESAKILKPPVNIPKLPQKNQTGTSPRVINSPSFKTTVAFASYRPPYETARVDPNNYGERFATDIYGVPVSNQPIIVLHETSDSASSAINTFQTSYTNENKQVSYHSLVKLDGTVVYLVPPDKRAFGAGNSVFDGPNGSETVQTNANLPPSVNNFAYHVSLETPPDGRGDNRQQIHSGYTEAQYYSLAWLIAQSQVPDDRITTHRAVDRSGQRVDPVNFDFDKFLNILHDYREPIAISRLTQ
jgi:N-acetylmuramoyl-L-alanine amidase